MHWFLFATISAILLGFYDVCKKQSLKDNAVIVVLFLNTLISSVIFLPFLVLSLSGLWAPGDALYVPEIPLQSHLAIAIKSILVLSSWFFGYIGIKHLPLSIVGPMNATRPVLVLLGAVVLFSESLSPLQWCGVATAIVAFYLLSRSGKKEGIAFSHNRWIYAVAAACILGACCGLYDKHLMASPAAGGLGLDRMAVQTYYNFYQCAIMGTIGMTYWWRHRQSQPFHWAWTIPAISVFLSAADFAYLYALSHDGALIAVVSMVRRASVVVSFAYAALVLREKNIRSKAIDLALVLLSMIFLALGTIASTTE